MPFGLDFHTLKEVSNIDNQKISNNSDISFPTIVSKVFKKDFVIRVFKIGSRVASGHRLLLPTEIEVKTSIECDILQHEGCSLKECREFRNKRGAI